MSVQGHQSEGSVAAPSMARRAMAELRGSGIGAFAAGTIVYQTGRLALSLIAARILGPETFGDWVLIMLLVIYLNATGLGITNGAGREMPFLAGAGQGVEAKRVADVATGATVVSGMVAGLAAALLAALLLGGRMDGIVLLLIGLAAALQHPFLLQQVLFRSWFAFRSAALQLTLLGVVVLISGVALVIYGIAGLLVSQIITYVVAIGLGVMLLPHLPRPIWDLAAVRPLIAVGFPIMLAGLMYGFLTTIDRWLVATFLDRADVGYYGLVGIVISGLLLVPQLLSQQFYPRMAFAYGQGQSRIELLHLARTQGALAGVAVAAIAAMTAAAAFAVVPIALPEYRPSLVPLLVALVGLVGYAFGSGYGNLLNTVGAHRRFLLIQTVALIANVALAVALLAAGFRLEAVALASALGMGLYSIMLYRTATAAAAAAS